MKLCLWCPTPRSAFPHQPSTAPRWGRCSSLNRSSTNQAILKLTSKFRSEEIRQAIELAEPAGGIEDGTAESPRKGLKGLSG
jgi:hypothetical protein